jgi:hypothetical protein
MPVYVIALKGEETEFVKIGWSECMKSRVFGHQTSNHKEVVVLRLIDAPFEAEAWMHKRFRSLRTRGEWFRYAPEIMTVIPGAVKPKKNMARAMRSVRNIKALQKKIAEIQVDVNAPGGPPPGCCWHPSWPHLSPSNWPGYNYRQIDWRPFGENTPETQP